MKIFKAKTQQQNIIERQHKSSGFQFFKTNKKQKYFYRLQNMHIYCKNCKKHRGNTFPKKISPDFKE